MSVLNWDNVDLKAACPRIHSISFPVMFYGETLHTLTFDPPLTTLAEVKDAVCACLDQPIDTAWLENYGMCADVERQEYETDEDFWSAYLEHAGYPERPIPTRAEYLFPYIYLFHVRSDGTIVMHCSHDSSKKEVKEALNELIGEYDQAPQDGEVITVTWNVGNIPCSSTGLADDILMDVPTEEDAEGDDDE